MSIKWCFGLLAFGLVLSMNGYTLDETESAQKILLEYKDKGFTLIKTNGRGVLREKKMKNYRALLFKNKEYLMVATGSSTIDALGVYVYNPSGKRMKLENKGDADEIYYQFQVPKKGSYTFMLMSTEGSGSYRFFLVTQ